MTLFKKRNWILVMVLLTIMQATGAFIDRVKAGAMNRHKNLLTAHKNQVTKSIAAEKAKKDVVTPVPKLNVTTKKNNQGNDVLKSEMTINATSMKDNQENTMPKSEMKAMIDRLILLEDNLSILNNKTKDQANEINFLKKSAVNTNEKHESEMNSLKNQVNRLESKLNTLTNNEIAVGKTKVPSAKREKRQVSPNPRPTCKKEECPFDYSIKNNNNKNIPAKIESGSQSNNANIELPTIEDQLQTIELPIGSKKPTSCADLALLGHKNSGFYLVQGRQSDSTILPNKIESVYCDFTTIQANTNMLQLPSTYGVGEKRIGYVDSKSSMGVYFYFGRKSSHSMSANKPGVVLFDREILNVGGAMSSSSIFTAPVSGIYYFSFSAVRSSFVASLTVHLRVNNIPVAEAYASTSNPSDDYFAMSLQSTLKLKSGDRVDIYKDKNVILKDDETSLRLTHYTGWLLEETLQDI